MVEGDVNRPIGNKGSPLQVVVVGAGGLGVSACWGLLAEWYSEFPLELHIHDPDQVDRSNLNRQVLFGETDIGKAKSLALCQRLQEIAPCDRASLHAHQSSITCDTIDKALKDAALVLDACDCTRTKFLLNDYCVSQEIPLIYGGAVEEHGQLLSIAATPGRPCLRCLFGELSAAEVELQTNSCRRDGIFGSVVGQVGFLQAAAAIKLLAQPTAAG